MNGKDLEGSCHRIIEALSENCLEGLRKTRKETLVVITGVPREIRNAHIPNTSLEPDQPLLSDKFKSVRMCE
jgi:hypothetical protein